MTQQKTGRPTKQSPEIMEEIFRDIAEGITLAEICRREHMPDRSTVYDWLKADDNLSQRFARARELGFDRIAEETLEIADDGSNDWMKRRRQDGSTEEVVDAEHIQRSRLRVDTRLKLLAKWDPKRYGDKLELGGSVALRHEDMLDQLDGD